MTCKAWPLKVEAVYLVAYETFEKAAADLPRFIDAVYQPVDEIGLA